MKAKTGKPKSGADWQKLNECFAEAVELEPTAQAEFLRQITDESLQNELAAMLKAVQKAERVDFLKGDAFSVGAEVLVKNETAGNDRIGKYKIVRELGRGGMGAVFLATREDFRQQVALKIIKRGMDTDEIIRRFHQERQVLATLVHPNIARLLDGGVGHDGLPFFAMEYIEGETIVKYCDTHRLSIEERLVLFRKVCAAVAYAHQNLVVHRDIKPSNILVDKGGEPKLLDFGISKLLAPNAFDSELEQTATGVNPLTPEYASPEQIRGERVTTASDIYSLGVLLYELLSGHRPFASKDKSYQEVVKRVLTEEPLPPSSALVSDLFPVKKTDEIKAATNSATRNPKSELRNPKSLRGDLDNIVLMALRKEPGRRYSSVEQFSEDLRRHLTGLPVLARADTFAYRAGKYIKRNRTALILAGFAMLVLMAGLSAILWEAHIARTERAKAERRFNDVRELANSVVFELHDAIENLPGSTSARELLVKRALEYLDRLAQEAEGDADLQGELAIAYEKIGTAQGNPYSANLGDVPGAYASYYKALAIREKLVALPDAPVKDRYNLARSYSTLADLFWSEAKNDEALDYYRKALALNEPIADRFSDTDHQFTIARNYYLIAQVLLKKGDFAGALENYRTSTSIFENLTAEQSDESWKQTSIAIGRLKIGELMRITDNVPEALINHRRALQYFETKFAEGPNDGETMRLLPYALKSMALDLIESGQPNDALPYAERALRIQKDLSARDAQNVQIRSDISSTYTLLGDISARLDKNDEAVARLQKSIDILQELLRANPTYNENIRELAIARRSLGKVLLKKNDPKAALDYLQAAVAILEAEPARTEQPWELAGLYEDLGDAQTDKTAAQRFYQQSRDLWIDLQNRNIRAKPATSRLEELARKIALP